MRPRPTRPAAPTAGPSAPWWASVSLDQARFGCESGAADALRLREDLIEQKINHHPGDGYVHPKGPCPAGDLAVKLKTLFYGPTQSHQNHRDNHHLQQIVGDTNGEVNRAKQSRTLEGGCTSVKCHRQKTR